MTLRLKTFVIVSAAIAGLMALLSFLTSSILIHRFENIEADLMREHLHRLNNAIHFIIDRLDTAAIDYATWNDTFNYVQEPNDEYLKSNFGDGMIAKSKVNMVCIADVEGRILFARSFDSISHKGAPADPLFINWLTHEGAGLLMHTHAESSHSGLISVLGTPLLIASRPIMASTGTPPIKGTLLFGRYLDEREVKLLADGMRLSVKLQSYHGEPLSDDFRAAKASLTNSHSLYVKALSDHSVAGYALLRNIAGNPAYVMSLQTERPIYAEGLITIALFLVLISVSVILFGVVILILIQRMVLTPVNQLANQVERIGVSSDLAARVMIKGDGDLVQLAAIINQTLAQLQQTHNDLRRAHDELALARKDLEKRVDDRTRELLEANRTLSQQIQERQHAERALRESEGKYRIVADNTHDWEFWLSPEGRFVYSSPSCKAVSGHDAEAYIKDATLFERLVHPEDIDGYRQHARQCLAPPSQANVGGFVFTMLFRLMRGNKEELWIEQVSHQVWNDQGVFLGVRGSNRDVTKRKHLEERLRQVQKLEAIGQLAAGVAHDFNNILTVIRGHADLLSARKDISPEAADSIAEIAVAARRASDVTRQLLAFSRHQVLQIGPVDLNDLVRNLVKMLMRLLGEHIQLNCEYASHLPIILADASLIDQIIINLTVNARDAMPNGGCLTLATGVIEINPGGESRNPEAQAGSYATIIVADAGTGMDPETLSHVFEPFFTTKAVGKGTGLGLSTVHGIVKQHGGWIEVTSEPGKGATFTVFLPIQSKAGISNPTSPIPHRGPLNDRRSGQETILVVEDEEPVRALICATLRKNGYQVLEAGNGPDAEAVFQSRQQDIKLVLTDIVMPEGISGWDLGRRLYQRQPSLKVVFSSGYNPEIDKAGNSGVPGSLFLQKPYQSDTLLTMVRNCLDSASEQPKARLGRWS